MRKYRSLSSHWWRGFALVVLAASLLCARGALAARPEPENQPDPRTRAFPHIAWAENYEGGKLRVLFVANGGSAWDVYALAARMDMEFDVFYTATPWEFAPKADYYGEGIRLFPEAQKELQALVEKPWDVIAFVDYPPYGIPAPCHYAVMEKVANGAGAVTFNCGRWLNSWNYPGVKEEKRTELLAALPLSAFSLPSFEKADKEDLSMTGSQLLSSYRPVVKPQELPPVIYRTVGKGRILEFAPGGGNYFGGPAMHPALNQDPEELLQNEYFYALAAKLVLLAAGKGPPVRIVLDADGKTFEPGKPAAMVAKVDGAFSGDVKIVVRTPRNEIRHEGRIPARLDAAGELTCPLPVLPAGRYYVDTWLVRGGKTVDWASAAFVVRAAAPQITDLALSQGSYAPTGQVRAAVAMTGTGRGATATARIRDASGRILAEERGITISGGKAAVVLPLGRTREVYHLLEVDLVQDSLTADTRKKPFLVPRAWDNDLFVFTDGDARNLLGKLRFDIFREYGVCSVQVGSGGGEGGEPAFTDLALAEGLAPSFRIWLSGCSQQSGGCIASKTYREALGRSFKETASYLKPYGLNFFSIGDDSGTSSDFCGSYPIWVRSLIVKFAEKYRNDSRKFYEDHGLKGWGEFWRMTVGASLKDVLGMKLQPGDLDLFKQAWRENCDTIEEFNRASKTTFKSFDEIKEEDLPKLQYVNPCVLGFRDAMKARYGGIAPLNAAWDTQLGSFEEITNELVEALVPLGRFGAKLDKIGYLEDLFILNMRAAGQGVHSVSPEMGVGMGAASFGNIIPDVLECIDSSMPYKGDRDIEIIRSVPHRFCGQTIGVYGGKAVRPSARENQAWETVFTGGNFIWFWSMCTGGLEGDLSMNPNRSGVMLRNIREMQGGLARALINGKRLHDGIAILHERRAGALSAIHKEISTLEATQVGFQRVIEDLGLQYRYTWTKEVENGVLKSGEFKVLILPYTQILSDREAEAIRGFVQDGGMLIADMRVATHGWNGAPRAKGQLDDVFGIEQSCAEAKPVKGALRWTAGIDGTARKEPVDIAGMRGDGGVKAAGARALAKIGDAPAMLVNTFGKGKAVFLNHAPTTYGMLLNRGKEGDMRSLYRAVLASGGVERRFKVVRADGSDIPGAELAVFKNGPIEYLTLEKNAYECETYPVKGAIVLDREYEVYDARAGKKIGRTARIPVELAGLGCYVYTLLPYSVSRFTADAPSKIRRGEDATVAMRLTVKDGAPGPHTVRVDILRPDGTRLWPMYKKEMQNGEANVVWPVALNEEPGKWTVVATDVTTGLSERRTVKVVE